MSHRIHSVSPDGPVGQTGKVHPGDFLIEVNGVNVLEMTHPEVVKLIQTLPRNIRLIVARFRDQHAGGEYISRLVAFAFRYCSHLFSR